MSYSASFQQLFGELLSERVEGKCIVIDHTQDETNFRELRLVNQNAIFDCYDTAILKGWPYLEKISDKKLLDKDCDGWVIHQKEGREMLLFAELKATGGTKTWTKALQQLMYSFLKIHMLSSLCADYDLSQIKVHFVLACQNYKEGEYRAEVDHRINADQQLRSTALGQQFSTTTEKILSKLRTQKKTQFRCGDIKLLQNIPLHSSLAQTIIDLSLVVAENQNETYATLIL